MSDIDDFDDFVVDDSFLQAVDNIAANANTGGANVHAAGPSRNTLKPSSASTLVNAPGRGGNGGTSASTSSSKHNGSVGRLNFASTSNSKRLVQQKSAPELKLSQRPIAPSSDDFDDFSIAPEDLLALDANPRQPLRTQSLLPWSKGPLPSSGSRAPPGKAGLGRTSSSGDGFQLHLNFRKESQVTKGKRWDRTKFAESGRRIVKGKGKFQPRSWGQEGDDQKEDEDEDFEPLVPGPKPLVDMSEYNVSSSSRRGRWTDVNL
jgi:ATP-dependent DNA helicase MPH1